MTISNNWTVANEASVAALAEDMKVTAKFGEDHFNAIIKIAPNGERCFYIVESGDDAWDGIHHWSQFSHFCIMN